jgi:NADH-quinone oxidoreductase subunit J
MTIAFLILAILAIAGTAAAMALRNLVHCVLALTVGLVGLAALFLQLGAQFVGFTQILVYIGAVAILAVFAIMMTRSADQSAHHVLSVDWLAGALVAGGVFVVLGWAIYAGVPTPSRSMPAQPEASVNQIGIALMHHFVLPLEIVGVLLTAALIGAAVLAMDDATVQKAGLSEDKETR